MAHRVYRQTAERKRKSIRKSLRGLCCSVHCFIYVVCANLTPFATQFLIGKLILGVQTVQFRTLGALNALKTIYNLISVNQIKLYSDSAQNVMDTFKFYLILTTLRGRTQSVLRTMFTNCKIYSLTQYLYIMFLSYRTDSIDFLTLRRRQF